MLTCEKVKQLIVFGCDNYLQADAMHRHIVNCKDCTIYKAKCYNVSPEQIIESLFENNH